MSEKDKVMTPSVTQKIQELGYNVYHIGMIVKLMIS